MKQIQTGEVLGFLAGAVIAGAGIYFSTPLAILGGGVVCIAVVLEYLLKG